MKALNVSELDNVVATLRPLLGARLQEVQTTANDLILGFYTNGTLLWLWVDLSPIRPLILPWTDLPLRLKWVKTPLNLFLRAHFINRALSDICRVRESGRVVCMKFGHAQDVRLELEMRLFPHGRNILARADGKQVSWQKPVALEPAVPDELVAGFPTSTRTLDELRDQWLTLRSTNQGAKKRGVGGIQDVRTMLERELERRQKALAKVEEELSRKKDLPWRSVGEWIKEQQSLNVPKEWEPFVDRRRKLSWNVEECFARARDLEGKVYGTEKRREILLIDIANLKEQLAKPKGQISAEPIHQRASPVPVVASQAKGRSLKLSDEITVIAGKSAADNIKLLRKARAWDLWIHMRDFPSSHAILFRNKGTKISDVTLQTVADWFVRQHFGKKIAKYAGERLQLVIAECRHVRPIKGDKLGRVTYQDEKTFIYRFPTT